MTSPEFVFTTLYPAPAGYQVPFLPRARTCIFRGMWADLPLNSRNKAEMNKKVFESDLLTLTTDFRMTKIPGIFMSSEETGDTSMSGGGGPVEAVFWIKEVGVQWRFKGEGYVVGKDIDHVTSKGARLVKKKVGERMRPINGHDQGQWSWDRELTAHFGNLSPAMRGSFKNPIPGSPVSMKIDDPRLSLGQKVEDLQDEVARENFRVIIIVPSEVEKLDLSIPEKARRWRYSYIGSSKSDVSEWETEELWP